MSLRHVPVLVVLALCLRAAQGGELPAWTGKLRTDHPRLFFNRDTWPEVRQRALGAERAWYEEVKRRVERLKREARTPFAARDLGREAACSAFVYRMTEDSACLELAQQCLDASLRYYDECFAQRKTVNWYSTSRVHAILAWDWLYEDLAADRRGEYLSRLVEAIDRVLKAKPAIYRENLSGYSTGFYGVRNCLWFVGCTGFGTGIEEERIRQWLVWGHDENLKLLAHRRTACGDDGGGASPTLGYVFGAYPWAEQNFFYTWLSSTGEDLAPHWPHGASLANYVIWNWIAAEPQPHEFGYGDTPHVENCLPIGELFTHMANIRHLHGQIDPQAAGLARYVQELLPRQSYSSTWFMYPFLWSRLDQSPPPLSPRTLPSARHFETMGQVFMRSGIGAEDTYCLFTCGGILRQHRHFDALNFVIYRNGFLALDSGTRYDEFTNGAHLANYFAQTVAHNCVVVHQPGEPPAAYWGGQVVGNHGGQHQALGSELKAFETNDALVYVAGDATACYQHGDKPHAGRPGLPEKCSLATRQMVFLLPDCFVIFDRVTTTDPTYRKDWLIHTAHEPRVADRTIQADHGRGRMFCRTCLPADAALSVVGGPGKEFWAAGRNWEIQAPRLTAEQRALMGQWRVEVTPGQPRSADLFLHVIEVGDQTRRQMRPVEVMQQEGLAGVRLAAGGEDWEIMFRTQGDLGGHVRRRGRVSWDRELAAAVQPQSGIEAAREEAARGGLGHGPGKDR
ncbi:MAG: hypothetical protein GX575_06515 [Candidatus Anammoximicrobium sp.]|nr:hypothetical protein [Candidatus Anammoximicrobium sp.]